MIFASEHLGSVFWPKQDLGAYSTLIVIMQANYM